MNIKTLIIMIGLMIYADCCGSHRDNADYHVHLYSLLDNYLQTVKHFDVKELIAFSSEQSKSVTVSLPSGTSVMFFPDDASLVKLPDETYVFKMGSHYQLIQFSNGRKVLDFFDAENKVHSTIYPSGYQRNIVQQGLMTTVVLLNAQGKLISRLPDEKTLYKIS